MFFIGTCLGKSLFQQPHPNVRLQAKCQMPRDARRSGRVHSNLGGKCGGQHLRRFQLPCLVLIWVTMILVTVISVAEDLSLYFHIGNNKYTGSKKNKPEVVSLNQRFYQIFSGKCWQIKLQSRLSRGHTKFLVSLPFVLNSSAFCPRSNRYMDIMSI